MANGFEPLSSVVLPDRYDSYRSMLVSRLNVLKEIQKTLDTSQFVTSEEFAAMLNENRIELEYLNGNNEIEIKNATMSVATNLYVMRL